MRACPSCGNANPDGAPRCTSCGTALSPAPAPGGFKQTMLGGMSPVAAFSPPVAPPPAHQAAPVPAPAPAAAPATAAPAPAASFKGTMLGMPSPFAAGAMPVAAPPAPAPVQPPPQAPHNPSGTQPFYPAQSPAHAAPAGGGGLKQTMLGFGAPSAAAPGPAAPPPAYAAPQPPAPAPTAGPGSAARVGASPPLHQQTMLGVARPGIAPLRAGSPTAPPETMPSAPEPAAPMPKLEAPKSSHRGPTSDDVPVVRKRTGVPKGAIALIVVAALLAVTAGVVAFLWEAPRPIRAEVVLDDRGSEGLSLTCDDCADGTVVAIGSAKATFKSKKAVLQLAKALEVGKNDMTVSVQRPGIGRNEEVGLSVSVDYRVRGDLAALAEDPPKVKVLVQAAPNAAVLVDGKAVPLDATGKGEYVVDVSHDLEGPADTIAPFERKLPYTVSIPGGQPHQGEVTLRFGIAPLRIDAPGNGIVIEGETFMLSGHTLKEGRISVSGRPITVDAEGRFAQLMNVSSIGETTIVVRAEAKDHAPRLVRVRVKRVASLSDAATEFRKSAIEDYASLADGSKKGVPAALEGEVAETRIDGEVTVLVLDVKTGCPTTPCLAKVIYGGRFTTKRGATVGAYGTVLGLVDGPRTGAQIPELSAEFLLPLKKRH